MRRLLEKRSTRQKTSRTDCPGSKLHIKAYYIHVYDVKLQSKAHMHTCLQTYLICNYMVHVCGYYAHMGSNTNVSGKAERSLDRSVWAVQCLVAANFQVAIWRSTWHSVIDPLVSPISISHNPPTWGSPKSLMQSCPPFRRSSTSSWLCRPMLSSLTQNRHSKNLRPSVKILGISYIDFLANLFYASLSLGWPRSMRAELRKVLCDLTKEDVQLNQVVTRCRQISFHLNLVHV